VILTANGIKVLKTAAGYIAMVSNFWYRYRPSLVWMFVGLLKHPKSRLES